MITTEQNVKLLIGEIADLRTEEIDNDSELFDLGLDEIDILDLVMELENQYDVEMAFNKLANIDTVQDLINFFSQYE